MPFGPFPNRGRVSRDLSCGRGSPEKKSRPMHHASGGFLLSLIFLLRRSYSFAPCIALLSLASFGRLDIETMVSGSPPLSCIP